ncbi:MAG TPA: thioredoxin family protein [Candidatus Bathyarchaeia archaeon]|nr:thioredoxin family protein [Candidatus Bathyarchaeia archaeon]
MTGKVIEFTTLEKTGRSPLDSLAPRLGVAYVVAVTRDGCPACKRQKPKLDKLAKALVEKHGSRVVFTRIHVNYSPESQDESLRSKDLLRHYFYPTNLIVVRSKDRGAIEYYRNASPDMRELRKNIEKAVEVTEFFRKGR